MTVYIVVKGEQNEGGNVVGVFRYRDRALVCALAQPSINGWKRAGDDEYEWHSACDFVRVERHSVR